MNSEYDMAWMIFFLYIIFVVCFLVVKELLVYILIFCYIPSILFYITNDIVTKQPELLITCNYKVKTETFI